MLGGPQPSSQCQASVTWIMENGEWRTGTLAWLCQGVAEGGPWGDHTMYYVSNQNFWFCFRKFFSRVLSSQGEEENRVWLDLLGHWSTFLFRSETGLKWRNQTFGGDLIWIVRKMELGLEKSSKFICFLSTHGTQQEISTIWPREGGRGANRRIISENPDIWALSGFNRSSFSWCLWWVTEKKFNHWNVSWNIIFVYVFVMTMMIMLILSKRCGFNQYCPRCHRCPQWPLPGCHWDPLFAHQEIYI